MIWNIVELDALLSTQFNINNAAVKSISPYYSQQLTHQTVKGQFISIGLKKNPSFLNSYSLSNYKEIKKLAFPQFINQYLSSNIFS